MLEPRSAATQSGNQLLDVVVVVGEAVVPDELEVLFELPELAAGVELSDDFEGSLPDLASLLPLAEAGFAEEYRSLYHPPPLKWAAGAVRVRSIRPLQCGHTVNGASANFWIFSVRRPHSLHSYS